MADHNHLEPLSMAPAPCPATGALAGDSWARGIRLEAFANLAHELRTPLQVMLGYLDILRDECAASLDDEPRRIVERMNASAHQLAQTVENIMEFACPEAAAVPLVEQQVSLAELIGELMPIFEAANKHKGLFLNFDLERAPARIRSRYRALRLIVQNLVLNAIKFTAAGSVNVAIRRSGDGVEIEVRDTGPGISPDELELAFEPFTQLSRSSVRLYRGVGLGLAVVKRDVAELGGTIEARSTPGAGSTFVVRIPGRRATASEAATLR